MYKYLWPVNFFGTILVVFLVVYCATANANDNIETHIENEKKTIEIRKGIEQINPYRKLYIYINYIYIYTYIYESFLFSILFTDNCFMKDVDSFGYDIDIKTGTDTDPINDADACQELCQKNDDCIYFVYGKNFDVPLLGERDVCWLKNNKTELKPHKDLIFGPKRCEGYLQY